MTALRNEVDEKGGERIWVKSCEKTVVALICCRD